MKKHITKMPSKVGKVGRKKLVESEKKIRLDVWQKVGEVELLGGKKAIETLFCEFFETKVNITKALKPVEYND